jgi:hypothetical protein
MLARLRPFCTETVIAGIKWDDFASPERREVEEWMLRR